MQKNMGTPDRMLRVLLFVVIGVLYISGEMSGTAALVLGVFGVVFAATGLLGFCPLYASLGFSSMKRKRSS